jgi:hypothetical protein
MPWIYTLEVEMPDEFKAFGSSLEDAQRELLFRWIGFSKNVHLCNEVIGKLKNADSFDDVKKVSELSEDHKQLVGVILNWFEGSCAEDGKMSEYQRFTVFKLMVADMANTSAFGDKLRQLVFNGEHHACVRKVIKAEFADQASAPVVDARTLDGLKPCNYDAGAAKAHAAKGKK